MAPLVAGPALPPRPPSDPPDSKFKIDVSSNPPDPPVPPDPPPDTLFFMGFLQLYDLWTSVSFPQKFSSPKLWVMISYAGSTWFFPYGTIFVLAPFYRVRSHSFAYIFECGRIIYVWVDLVLLDPSLIVLVPSPAEFSYAIGAFVGFFVAYVCSFTAVCRCCSFTAECRCYPFTAVCRFTSIFVLIAFAMIWHTLLLWQLGVKFLKLCIHTTNLVCLGFICLPFSFKECFFLPHVSLAISEIVTGSFVLKMVLFEAEAKMFIVSCLDSVNYLTSLTMKVFSLPFYCFVQECPFEEVFLCDWPLSETTVVELVISHLSLNFYLSTCCLSFTIWLSSVLVYALVCLALCSFIVSSSDGVELF